MDSSAVVSQQTLRIIDASLNRIGEGLRLLENVARLLLDDAVLTRQLKNIRHDVLTTDWPLNRQLIQARDATGDVGVNIEALAQQNERDLPALVVANARRVQESLRVLEEMAKLPDAKLPFDHAEYRQARFALYTIERDLLSKLQRQDKIKNLSGLYVIIDAQALQGRSYIDVAEQVIRGGASTIQLRDKIHSKKEILPVARQLQDLCAEHGVLFIINDSLDIALAIDADGLHLGQEDLPVAVARKLLPIDKVLGVSTKTVEQAVSAVAAGADYVAVGSIYRTSSKEVVKVVGLEMLREVSKVVSVPLVAIGGISPDNAAEVMAAGADAVAVISAVIQAVSPEEAAHDIVAKLTRGKDERVD